MKISYTVLLLLVSLTSCVASRYELNDKGADKKFLVHYIKEQSKAGIISKKPLVVVDGFPLRYNDELKKGWLRRYKRDDIFSIRCVDVKGSTQIWGTRYGKDGAVIINIRRQRRPNNRDQKRIKKSSQTKPLLKRARFADKIVMDCGYEVTTNS